MTWEECRRDFPILEQRIGSHPLCYLDNSATTQLPEPVLREMELQYHGYEANVHRGIHYLSEASTRRMEDAREDIRRFLGAASMDEIIFTSGCTAAINLVARSLSFSGLTMGDEILVTQMEHHSNFLPWQEACRRTGAAFRVVPVLPDGRLDLERFSQMLTEQTRLVAITWVSNVTGCVNPVETIIHMAHQKGALVLVDASQAMRHVKMDVQALDCDFLCFSGHKMMGPTGTGILYGKRSVLERLEPETFGGGMVDLVGEMTSTYDELPYRLEAGTPNIAGNIGLGAAVRYLETIGIEAISRREAQLLAQIRRKLSELPQVQLLGAGEMAGCLSFCMDGCSCYDAARLLSELGAAVRSGTHCAQPYLAALGVNGTVRVSPAFYNTEEDLERFFSAMQRITGRLTKQRSNIRRRGHG